jgi:tetratricopeptide (TPR) repeat protein
MTNLSDRPTPEAYVLSLLAEGRYTAAFQSIGEFGQGHLYAPDFCNHAYQMMENKLGDAAADLFSKAIALDPALAQAHAGLGILYLRQGKYGYAVEALRKSISLNPDSAGAQAALGIALCNSHKINEAIPYLERALELSPSLPAAITALQDIHKALSQENKFSGKKSKGKSGASSQWKALLTRIDAALQRNEEAKPASRLQTVSVCMIVKNEEHNLARCLRSVQKAADEIIVVDTGSADRTVEVAKSLDATVEYFKWCDDFAAARNYALSHATSDWILIMDADDEMDAGGDVSLRTFLNEPRPEVSICSLRTRVPCPGGLETFIEHPRLFRNHIGLHYVNGVHEQLAYPDGSLTVPELATGISVYHHGYLDSSEDMQERGERNFRILHAELEHKPDDALTNFFMGKEFRSHKRFEEAVPYLKRAVELMTDQPTSFLRMKAFSHLAECLVAAGRVEEGEDLYYEALQYYPDNPELLFGLGEAKRLRGQEDQALLAYEAATKGCFGNRLASQDFACRDLKPRLRMAEIALLQGRLEEAEAQWQITYAIRGDVPLLLQLRQRLDDARAKTQTNQLTERQIQTYRAQLQLEPDDLRTRANLVSALIAVGRAGEAEDEASTLAQLSTASPESLSNLQTSSDGGAENADTYVGMGEALLLQKEWDRALESYESALKLDPRHVGAWLGLARIYLEKQILQAALSCYEKAMNFSGGAPEVMAELTRAKNHLRVMAANTGQNAQVQAGARS